MIGMPGCMGRTSPAGSLPRATPPCCSQSAMHGARSTRWCTKAPRSPRPSRISGATSSSGNGRSMSTSTGRRRRGRARARHPRCGRLSGRSPRRGGKAPGPTRSKPKGKGGKGKSPNTPSVPWPDHWAFKNPKGVAYCRDHHLHNKCSGSCGRSHNCPVRKDGWVCDAPPQACPHLPTTAEGRQSGGGQDGLRWEGTSPEAVPARALEKGGSIPFPRTH